MAATATTQMRIAEQVKSGTIDFSALQMGSVEPTEPLIVSPSKTMGSET